MSNWLTRLGKWVVDSISPPPVPTIVDDSPFEYVTKDTDELEIGDYIVAYSGYVQRIGLVECNGSRLVVTKCGKSKPIEFTAYEGDLFVIRTTKED